MIYPRLISSLKWKFYNVLFERKTKNEEKMCDKIVDFIYKTFTRKYYLVKISQLKKKHLYLIVTQKTGRLLDEEKKCAPQKNLRRFSKHF